jgi:hypothetical protein
MKKNAPAKKVVPEILVAEIPPEDLIDDTKSYWIEVQFVGEEPFSAEGDTMLEALETLKRPLKIMSKGFVRIDRDGEKKELFFMPVQMKRMFYPIAASVNAKILEMNLK